MVSADLLGDPIMMDEVRSKLVFQIAEGLMQQDIVKWIYHYKDEMDRDHATIAAKLYVVPWEFMEEEKHGGTD